MKIIKYPKREDWNAILARPTFNPTALFDSVKTVLDDIQQNGDEAVKRYEEKFDKVVLSNLEVSAEEWEESTQLIDLNLKNAIEMAARNIEKFHEAQMLELPDILTSPGVRCWQKAIAIDKVGLYVPGGTAPLFSTVLMLAIPAQIAGCKQIILCTPPNKEGKVNPAILYAARIAGVKRVFKIGGIQAIGAMTYGTETVPNVYKIFGPGNQYVMAAKQMVSLTKVAIDMPAGPSEVEVIADEFANPRFVAADMLSQAEHGVDSQAIVMTDCEALVDKIKEEVE